MACTCRRIPRCPVCHHPNRLPLSELDSAWGASVLLDRFARRDSSETREGLRRLVHGTIPCSECGNPFQANHDRSCIGAYLSTLGVPPNEREIILGRISFPEA